MTGTTHDHEARRAGISALLARMRAEERRFEQELTPSERAEVGSPTRWGAKAVLAHTTDFKTEQIARLEAARDGVVPPEFPARDHADPDLCADYTARDWQRVTADAERAGTDLPRLVQALAGELLFTPGALPWLRRRALWASVLVRGVWHPSAHLHQYLAERGQLDRVLELQQSILDAATSAGIPDVPGGRPFALYNLACAHSLRGEIEPALTQLAEAVRLDPALAKAASDDDDLAAVRADSRFEALRAMPA